MSRHHQSYTSKSTAFDRNGQRNVASEPKLGIPLAPSAAKREPNAAPSRSDIFDLSDHFCNSSRRRVLRLACFRAIGHKATQAARFGGLLMVCSTEKHRAKRMREKTKDTRHLSSDRCTFQPLFKADRIPLAHGALHSRDGTKSANACARPDADAQRQRQRPRPLNGAGTISCRQYPH